MGTNVLPLLINRVTNIARDGVAFDDHTEHMELTMPASGSASNLKKTTLSFWMQRNGDSGFGFQFVYRAFSGQCQMLMTNGGELGINAGGAASQGYLETNTAPFATTGVPHHIMLMFDSAQAIAADRIRLWIDAVEVTVFGVDLRVNLNLNQDNGFASDSRVIGVSGDTGGAGLNATLADFYFLDGQAITDPALFAVDLGSGLLPADGSPDFGNRGFHLDFAASGDLGNDAGPNALDFSPTGITAADHVSPFL